MSTSNGRQKYRFFFQIKNENSLQNSSQVDSQNQYQVMKKVILAKAKKNKN